MPAPPPPARIETLRFTKPTLWVLRRLECETDADVARLAPQDILCAEGARRSTLDEVAVILLERGRTLSTTPTRAVPASPPAPSTSWGCLHVLWSSPDEARHAEHVANLREGLRDVTGAVEAAYDGAALVRPLAELPPTTTPLALNEARKLRQDEVLILPASFGWITVASHRWEWASVGAHPLAFVLSRMWLVASVTSIAGKYVEVSLYRDGELRELDVHGPEVPPSTPIVDALPLDLPRLARIAEANPAALDASRGAPEQFSNLAGLDGRGYRDAHARIKAAQMAVGEYLVLR